MKAYKLNKEEGLIKVKTLLNLSCQNKITKILVDEVKYILKYKKDSKIKSK